MNEREVTNYERLKWYYEQEIERIEQSKSYTTDDIVRQKMEWRKKGILYCLERLEYVYK